MDTGIYVIEHLTSGKKYIGSAVDFRARWHSHRSCLQRSTHHSSRLQNAWNKYGESAFEFRPLLVCSKADLLMYEQRCIDGYRACDRKYGYNTAPITGSSLGCKASIETRKKMSATRLGHKHSIETREKMREAGLRRKASVETREKMRAIARSRKYSSETRDKLRAAKAILSFAKAVQIRAFHARGWRARDIAKMYGVARPTIYGVTCGRAWSAPQSVIREQTL